MSRNLKLMLVAGARPNFMKVAPLVKRIRAGMNGAPHESGLSYLLVHTGQHYDENMSGIFFKELGIPAPDINLGAGPGSHAVQTANVMLRFEPVCLEQKPDWVIVVGDVNSSLACTLVAVKLGIRVAHVEAGLRSRDRTMPEEINRLATDAIADLLLTPSLDANENLRREGVPESKVKFVGNIMIDALVENLQRAREKQTLQLLGLAEKNFAYVTLHRPSNVDQRESLAGIMTALTELSQQLPVIFPMHPRTRKMLSDFGIGWENAGGLRVVDPVGYLDSVCLTENARFILTDSGGLQEESTFFRTPCLTLRPNTERPITVEIGSNRLTSLARLQQDLEWVLKAPPRIGQVPPLWDGKTASRILEEIIRAAE